MNLILTLAWRNLWRNKRRSMISLAAIAFALLMQAAQVGLQQGTYTENIEVAIRLSSLHMQVQAPDYADKPTLRNSFSYNAAVRGPLDSSELVTAYTPRIYSDGLISVGEKSMGVMIIALDPAAEQGISDFHKKVNAGAFLQSADAFDIVVGYKLLENLGAAIGDSVVVLSQGFDGYLGNFFFRIVGTIKTGSPESDRFGIFMPLGTAQELMGMWGRASVVAIALPSLDDIPAAQAELQPHYAAQNLAVRPWNEVLSSLKQMIEFDRISGDIQMLLLTMVIAIGILNTLIMSVTERFREFGIMLSLGMRNGALARMVMWEVLMLALLGVLAGNALALGVNAWLTFSPIELGGDLVEIYEEWGFLPIMRSSLAPMIFIRSSLTIFGFTLLAALYPVWKTFRLEPLRGIRYT